MIGDLSRALAYVLASTGMAGILVDGASPPARSVSRTAGAGVARAKARLAAHRKAQAERLKHAPTAVSETRQQRRAREQGKLV